VLRPWLGHGGPDPGAIGPTGVQEKQVVLNIVHRTASWLNRCSVRCVLTRGGDENVFLQRRCDIANQAGAVCFVSIHCNASENPSAEGLEVYYYEGSKEGLRLANLLNAQIFTDCNLSGARLFAVKEETIPFTAQEATELQNRGVKTAHYYVLKYTVMPAALVEVAFISNHTEEAWLGNPTNQELVGKALAKAVCRYLGVSWIDTWEEQRQAALRKLEEKAEFNTPHETTEQVDMGMLAVVLERLNLI
jgi:N-acetylmuramoyl-L-alanine amidase